MTQTEPIHLELQQLDQEINNEETSYKGLIIAGIVMTVWAISLIVLLSLDISNRGWWVGCAMIWQMFLYTGLFITAHDAMHGSVFPKNRKINDFIGTLVLLCYGLFDYQFLLKKHHLHHQHPGSELDPDFHDLKHKNFFAWYFAFMCRYWSWLRLFALILIFRVLYHLVHIPEDNLTLFWVVPSIASSLQLFFFGTFLPHREPKGGYTNPHFAQSTPLPVFLSFITCYHFGYHKEHHEHPGIPWWQLPEVYKAGRETA
jgi:beta-carotene ketolase (CrtW type)